ncbi:hypothetical protein Q8F55_001486 [Vanrija albida]|uniref:Uncharacterized protein n=1 Tax=Vanrija albida TaxID=181172 RepID=A0ABR3QG41_9TREE
MSFAQGSSSSSSSKTPASSGPSKLPSSVRTKAASTNFVVYAPNLLDKVGARDLYSATVPTISNSSLKTTVDDKGVPKYTATVGYVLKQIMLELDDWDAECLKPAKRGAVKVKRGNSRNPEIVLPITKRTRLLAHQLHGTLCSLACVPRSDGPLPDDFIEAGKIVRRGRMGAGGFGGPIDGNPDDPHDAALMARMAAPPAAISSTLQLAMTPIHHHFREKCLDQVIKELGPLLRQRNKMESLIEDLESLLRQEAAPFDSIIAEIELEMIDKSVSDGVPWRVEEVLTPKGMVAYFCGPPKPSGSS